jgi:uncharacterized protein YkwD
LQRYFGFLSDTPKTHGDMRRFVSLSEQSQNLKMSESREQTVLPLAYTVVSPDSTAVTSPPIIEEAVPTTMPPKKAAGSSICSEASDPLPNDIYHSCPYCDEDVNVGKKPGSMQKRMDAHIKLCQCYLTSEDYLSTQPAVKMQSAQNSSAQNSELELLKAQLAQQNQQMQQMLAQQQQQPPMLPLKPDSQYTQDNNQQSGFDFGDMAVIPKKTELTVQDFVNAEWKVIDEFKPFVQATAQSLGRPADIIKATIPPVQDESWLETNNYRCPWGCQTATKKDRTFQSKQTFMKHILDDHPEVRVAIESPPDPVGEHHNPGHVGTRHLLQDIDKKSKY